MKEEEYGRIVNISSIGVKYGGSPSSAIYTMSKSAIESITTSFAKAGAKHNILVNCIRIGVTNTKLHNLNPEKNMKKRTSMIPMQRIADPNEIAQSILFLISPESSFTTGSIFTVSGGE